MTFFNWSYYLRNELSVLCGNRPVVAVFAVLRGFCCSDATCLLSSCHARRKIGSGRGGYVDKRGAQAGNTPKVRYYSVTYVA